MIQLISFWRVTSLLESSVEKLGNCAGVVTIVNFMSVVQFHSVDADLHEPYHACIISTLQERRKFVGEGVAYYQFCKI